MAALFSAAVVREAGIDDAHGAAALFQLVYPEFVTTPAGTRHFMSTSPPAAQRHWWCAESEGEIIGWATAALVVDTSEEGVVWISLVVHPEHRGQGIGTTLAELAEQHATVIRARRILARSRADDASAAFVRSRGLIQTSSADLLVVDPRTVAAPDPPAGVALLPFAAFESDPSPVHHVDAVAVLDEPGDVTFDEMPFDRWLENFWRHPLLDHDASFVAAVDGVPAALTCIETDRELGRGSNNGTGTLPEYRRRGLATLAKRASLSRAATLGITAVYTGNDVTNDPMQAINKKLGYTPSSTLLSWARELATA